MESGVSMYPTTQDTGGRLPVVTTAPPVNVPNHQPLYRNLLQHTALLGPHSQPNYLEDSGGSSSHPSSQPTFSTSPFGTPLDNSDKRASDETAESSDMQTIPVMRALAATSRSNAPLPLSSMVLKDPEHAAIIPSTTAAEETDDVRPDQPGLRHNVSSGSDENETPAIITTMQSPGENTAFFKMSF